MSEINWR